MDEKSKVRGQREIPAMELLRLIESWKRRALMQFRCGVETRKESSDLTEQMGARLVEHGAACYANCTMELQELLKG